MKNFSLFMLIASAGLSSSLYAYADFQKHTLANASASFTIQSMINNHCDKLQKQHSLAVGACEKSLISEQNKQNFINYYLNTFTEDELAVFVSTQVLLAQPKNYSEVKTKKLLSSYQQKRQQSAPEFARITHIALSKVA